MENSPYQKDHQFSEIKAALLNSRSPFPTGMLYFFSDISQGDLEKLTAVWPKVETMRRRGLLEDMEGLAENDTLLFFDHVAQMCLDDEDPIARSTAIRLLWQSQQENLIPRLIKLMNEDPEVIVRAAAATGLGVFVYLGELEEINESTYKSVVDNLIQTHLSADDQLVRRRALEALGYASNREIPDLIQKAYESNDDEWLQSALFAMGRSYDKRWKGAILRMIDHPDLKVRYEAVRAAGELELEAARDQLFEIASGGTQDDDLYFAAIWSLTKIGGEGVQSLIEMSIDDTDDPDELQLLEEALENLHFTEQINPFDMMYVEEDDLDDWENE